jgi:orotate phosphoribosyltransferase
MNTTNHMLDGAALDAGAVKFDFTEGFPFVSGIQAPIYIDSRRLFFNPEIRQKTVDALVSCVKEDNIQFDVVAGVESGAIAPAALLASALKKPFVYVKKKPKDHGLKRMVECGDVQGMRVVLIEDMVSTGGSSLNAIQALRDAGATVTDEITIHRYEFPESDVSFPEAGVNLHVLALVADISREAGKRGIISKEEVERLINWLPKPHEHW